MYRIISKQCGLALRPEIRQKMNEQKDQIRIMGAIQDPKSIKQLWMFKTIKDGKKQIVNFCTDLVIENDNGDVKLERGKLKIGQRFQLELVGYNNERELQVRIKDVHSLYLTLDGTLQVAKSDQQDQTQIYILREVNPATYKQFQQTFLIVQPNTKKCLDVSKGQVSIGTSICLYQPNQRANQRWIFEPPISQHNQDPSTLYSIKNLLSGLRLWYSKKDGGLIQTDNRDRIWQLRSKNGYTGCLYCYGVERYVNRVQGMQGDQVRLEGRQGTIWQILRGL